jgi:hypothetical protein
LRSDHAWANDTDARADTGEDGARMSETPKVESNETIEVTVYEPTYVDRDWQVVARSLDGRLLWHKSHEEYVRTCRANTPDDLTPTLPASVLEVLAECSDQPADIDGRGKDYRLPFRTNKDR